MVVIPNLLATIVELSDKTCWNMVRDATGMCFVLYRSGIDKDLIKISHICPYKHPYVLPVVVMLMAPVGKVPGRDFWLELGMIWLWWVNTII